MGVPQLSRSRVARLQCSGAGGTSVQARQSRIDGDLQDAVNSVSGAIRYKTLPLATQKYADSGFGDLGSDWSDVAKGFATEIAKGVGGRISGQNPYITTAPAPIPKVTAAAGMPAWLTPVLLGSAALLGVTLVLRAVK